MKNLTEKEILFYSLAPAFSALTVIQFENMVYHFVCRMCFREIGKMQRCTWQAAHLSVAKGLGKIGRSKLALGYLDCQK